VSISHNHFEIDRPGDPARGAQATPSRIGWAGLALAAAMLLAAASVAGAQSGLSFNGTSSYVTFGPSAALGVSSFTVETWFRRDAAGVATSTGTNGWANIVPLLTKGRGEAETPANLNMNYFLGIRSDGRLAADFEEATGPNHPIGGVTAISNGTWYHAAVTFDAATGRYTLYLNGVIENDTTLAAGIAPASVSIQHAGLGTAMTSTGAAAGFFAGAMDEPRIWSVARTQAQIAAAMALELAAPQAGLVGRWPLNEGGGMIAGNCVPGGPDGTLTASPGWVAGATLTPAIPAAPTALLATSGGAGQVHLTWTDAACDESGYAIERSTTGTGGPFTPLATAPANAVSYDDFTVGPDLEYCYQVRAVAGLADVARLDAQYLRVIRRSGRARSGPVHHRVLVPARRRGNHDLHRNRRDHRRDSVGDQGAR
jgi:hypothetical protein